MKCSDCKLWKTSECKNNPEANDLDRADTLACFTRDPELPEASGASFRFAVGALLLFLAFVLFIIGALGLYMLIFGGGIFYQGTLMGSLDVGLSGKILYSFIWIITTLAIALGGWVLVHPKKGANTSNKSSHGPGTIMKCSDCKLWKTKDCRNNPKAADLYHADTFACFILKGQDNADY